MTGQRFGRLIALRDVGSVSACRIWELVCDCGTVIRAKGIQVRHGGKQSCGCLARELSSKRKRLKLLGQTFGRLFVEKCLGPDKYGAVKWQCRCECGGRSSVTGSMLVRGKTLSCGCLQREIARKIGDRCRKINPVSRTKKYRSDLRKRLRENPAHAMAGRLSRLMAFALQEIGELKTSGTFEMLGYSPDDLRVHIERQFLRGMSWENRKEWQLDHIVPISSAETIDDVVALNQLSNLRPLWSAENNMKRDRRENLL